MNRIVSFTASKARKVRGTDIKARQTLWAIQDEDTGLYFIWAYSNEEFCRKVSAKVTLGQHPNTDRETDIAANWRRSFDQLSYTDRTKFD